MLEPAVRQQARAGASIFYTQVKLKNVCKSAAVEDVLIDTIYLIVFNYNNK